MAFQTAQIFLIALAVSCCCAEGASDAKEEKLGDDRQGKFVAVVTTKTVTSTSFATTVVPTTVFPTCFTSLANITACAARRRRWLQYNERPIVVQIMPNGVILPAQLQMVETTALPDSQPKSLHSNIASLESSNPVASSFEEAVQAQAELGRFLYSTRTVTETTVLTLPTVSLSTVTGKQTATVSLVNCKPAGPQLTPVC